MHLLAWALLLMLLQAEEFRIPVPSDDALAYISGGTNAGSSRFTMMGLPLRKVWPGID